MICKFCGNVIEDNSDFCFICGQKVVTEAPAYAAPPTPAADLPARGSLPPPGTSWRGRSASRSS